MEQNINEGHEKEDLKKPATVEKTTFLLEDIIQLSKCNLANKSSESLSNISDVQMKLFHDFRIAGVRCTSTELKSSFVFEFCGKENDAKNDSYAVEILISSDGQAAQLGKSTLPSFVNIQDILAHYPLDNISNVQHFLNKCKQHVDCYNSRVKQFKKLQNLELSCVKVESKHDFTLIIIRISSIKDMNDPDNILNKVVLQLYYKFDETKPYKLSSVIEDKFILLSADLLTRLNKFFQPFLKLNLCAALLQINNFYMHFGLRWVKTITDNENDIETYEKQSEEFVNEIRLLYLFLHRGEKKHETSKNEREAQTDILDKNATETSLCVQKENSEVIDLVLNEYNTNMEEIRTNTTLKKEKEENLPLKEEKEEKLPLKEEKEEKLPLKEEKKEKSSLKEEKKEKSPANT